MEISQIIFPLAIEVLLYRRSCTYLPVVSSNDPFHQFCSLWPQQSRQCSKSFWCLERNVSLDLNYICVEYLAVHCTIDDTQEKELPFQSRGVIFRPAECSVYNPDAVWSWMSTHKQVSSVDIKTHEMSFNPQTAVLHIQWCFLWICRDSHIHAVMAGRSTLSSSNSSWDRNTRRRFIDTLAWWKKYVF